MSATRDNNSLDAEIGSSVDSLSLSSSDNSSAVESPLPDRTFDRSTNRSPNGGSEGHESRNISQPHDHAMAPGNSLTAAMELTRMTANELTQVIEDFRLQADEQKARIDQLELDMGEIIKTKNNAIAHAKIYALREKKHREMLIKLGEHPDPKVDLKALNREQCAEFDPKALLDPSAEDLAALTGYEWVVKVFKYNEKPKFNHDLVKVHYHKATEFVLQATHLKSYNGLGNIILRQADAQRKDINVILAFEIAPKLEEKPYLRVLHPAHFSIWIKKMADLKRGRYELHAYLYTDAEADTAYDRLELDSRILKY